QGEEEPRGVEPRAARPALVEAHEADGEQQQGAHLHDLIDLVETGGELGTQGRVRIGGQHLGDLERPEQDASHPQQPGRPPYERRGGGSADRERGGGQRGWRGRRWWWRLW